MTKVTRRRFSANAPAPAHALELHARKIDDSGVMDRIAALKRTKIFAELDEESLRALAERTVERRLRRGEMLFIAGEEARGIYVVVEGAVRAYRESRDGREQTIHVERAGGTLAEVSVFDDGPYPANAAAEEDSVVLFIEKRDVKQLCLKHPFIALAALKTLASRLRYTAGLIEALGLHEVGQRLAAFLLDEAYARGRRRADGTLAVDLQLTNQQIAARIGTVREVVSRAFARLKNAGLIELRGKSLLIQDERALALYAGRERDGRDLDAQGRP